MVPILPLTKHFWSGSRFTIVVIALSLLLLIAACREGSSEVTPTPSKPVMVTAMASYTIGELINDDGCIRIRNKDMNLDRVVIWPPDISTTIEGDQITIITGGVRGGTNEVVLNFGDQVMLSGGETTQVDETLLQNLPPGCEGLYWVVGFDVTPVQATDEP